MNKEELSVCVLVLWIVWREGGTQQRRWRRWLGSPIATSTSYYRDGSSGTAGWFRCCAWRAGRSRWRRSARSRRRDLHRLPSCAGDENSAKAKRWNDGLRVRWLRLNVEDLARAMLSFQELDKAFSGTCIVKPIAKGDKTLILRLVRLIIMSEFFSNFLNYASNWGKV